MSSNAPTVNKNVTNAAKLLLLAANPNRRGWLIQNLTANTLQIFFDGNAISAVQFSRNMLPGTYPGLIEGQLVAGGPSDIQVTEFL